MPDEKRCVVKQKLKADRISLLWNVHCVQVERFVDHVLFSDYLELDKIAHFTLN